MDNDNNKNFEKSEGIQYKPITVKIESQRPKRKDVCKEFNDRYSNIEPVGICRNIPFPCSVSNHSVGFVYKIDGDTYWCHFTEQLWFSLLSDVYGRKEANDIVYGNINDALSDLNNTLKEQIDKLEAYDNR